MLMIADHYTITLGKISVDFWSNPISTSIALIDLSLMLLLLLLLVSNTVILQ